MDVVLPFGLKRSTGAKPDLLVPTQDPFPLSGGSDSSRLPLTDEDPVWADPFYALQRAWPLRQARLGWRGL